MDSTQLRMSLHGSLLIKTLLMCFVSGKTLIPRQLSLRWIPLHGLYNVKKVLNFASCLEKSLNSV